MHASSFNLPNCPVRGAQLYIYKDSVCKEVSGKIPKFTQLLSRREQILFQVFLTLESKSKFLFSLRLLYLLTSSGRAFSSSDARGKFFFTQIYHSQTHSSVHQEHIGCFASNTGFCDSMCTGLLEHMSGS